MKKKLAILTFMNKMDNRVLRLEDCLYYDLASHIDEVDLLVMYNGSSDSDIQELKESLSIAKVIKLNPKSTIGEIKRDGYALVADNYDYIATIDHDDTVSHNFISRILASGLDENIYHISKINLIYNDTLKEEVFEHDEYANTEDLLVKWSVHKIPYNLPSYIIRSDLVKVNLEYFANENIFEEFVFLAKCIYDSGRVNMLPVFYNWDRTGSGHLSKNIDNVRSAWNRIYNRLCDALPEEYRYIIDKMDNSQQNYLNRKSK